MVGKSEELKEFEGHTLSIHLTFVRHAPREEFVQQDSEGVDLSTR